MWCLGHLLGLPVYQQNFDDGTDAFELVGGYGPKGFQPGELLRATDIKGVGGVYILDELNAASADVQELYNPALDGEGALTLSQKEGERWKINPDTFFVATCNPATKEYAGLKKYSEALLSRFHKAIVEPMTEDETRMILQGVSRRVARKVKEATDKTPRADRVKDLKALEHNFSVVSGWLVDIHHDIADGYRLGQMQRRNEPIANPRTALRLGTKEESKYLPDLSFRTMERALHSFGHLVPIRGYSDAFLGAIRADYAASAPSAEDRSAIVEHAKAKAVSHE
jgi:hypothetical protein